MGFWDALRGHSRPRPARLDQLFALPSAALSLEAALGMRPSGSGSVCFRAAEGGASVATQAEATALLALDGGPEVRSTVDEFGFTWLTLESEDVGSLVTDLHAVNSALEVQGFGPGLLCSVVGFRGATGVVVHVVYLYKQGTFYPFAPTGAASRDTLLERQVRDVLASELTIEPDTSRWMPIWGLGSTTE